MWTQSLGWEDPPEEELAAHSSILAGKSPQTEEPSELQSMRSQRIRHDMHAHTHPSYPTHTFRTKPLEKVGLAVIVQGIRINVV